MSTDQRLDLKAGEWVEVRSKEEILRTLDRQGQLDGMPFMPEMLPFCGQRLRVVSSAHKTCDTIAGTGGRRIPNAVHLEGNRCDGGGHDGCAARCLIFWKEAWLKRASAPDGNLTVIRTNGAGNGAGTSTTTAGAGGGGCTEADVVAAARAPDAADGPRYACQATELLRASTLLKWWDMRQYVDDYRSGNVGVGRLAMGAAYATYSELVRQLKHRPRVQSAVIAAYDRFQKLRGGVPFPRRQGTIPAGQKTPPCVLDLQPGELVRVKSQQEILATLDADNKNRGLYFDSEHVRYCGNTYKVLARVDKLVDEKTGKMLTMKTASLILEGVTCEAYYSDCRMFCPRAIYPYWREIWLERVGPAPAKAATSATTATAAAHASAPAP